MLLVKDLSLPLAATTPVFPGDPVPELRPLARIRDGAPLDVSSLHLHAHVGTHLDAPSHFLLGAPDLSAFPPDTFVGPAFVLDLSGLAQDRIEASDLGDLSRIPRRSRLLIRTRNSARWRDPSPATDLAFLDPQAIGMLVARRPILVGFDAYSLDPLDSTTFPAHTQLAEAGLPALVALDLDGVAAGAYTLVCPPLPVALEASPVRALLFTP
ncbi:cyclase family protein [Polyangium aurulentum]|uniref:cyclase family protein n=1 Tax=Polyangium aurulentum TaxID=2567896 RepID=UPI00146E99F0|nr:cyclase family protein [Polyangium aurulentum]UQA60581.1 cyclase family protein [Polyangium aurulentum]